MKKRLTPMKQSDALRAAEVRAALDDYCALANELLKDDMIINFSITNGTDGKPVSIASFTVTKVVRLPGEKAGIVQDNVEVK